MWYRIGAVRNMTGGRKTDPSTKMTDKLKTVRYNSKLVLSTFKVVLYMANICIQTTNSNPLMAH